jgi:hypothetical protein
MAAAAAAARADAQRGRGAQPPPEGTRAWVRGAPSLDKLLASLKCPICFDVFKQAR